MRHIAAADGGKRGRRRVSAGMVVLGMLAGATAAGQESTARAPEETSLRANQAMIVLDYQVIRVPGDKPIDLMGFHVHHELADWLYLAAGVYAPLVRGEYGGFTAYDIGGQVRQHLTSRIFATAGLAGGGGGGGRSIEQSKVLSGTGRFFKGHVGLGYDFGSFAVGVNVTRMKFSHARIDGTQANLFVELPYAYLTGPLTSHGQPLSPSDARLASEESGESMLTLVFDNVRQIKPEGSYKGSINIADLQYAHYFARDTYWYAGLGVGYRGLPLYNHVIGGIGQRVSLSPRLSVVGQLGIGSGGYAPEVMGTDSGLLVYPKISAEYALTKDLGLSLSAGYLAAPKGSSRNHTFGLALTHHIRSSDSAGSAGERGTLPTYRGFRVSVFQQTEYAVRYRDVDRGRLQMLGIQADTLVDDHWYVPLQAAVAYSAYLGYPGYGELLAGIGVQGRARPESRVQLFAQLMVGANVHGPAAKAGAGLRYGLSDRLALHLAAGRIEARSSAGQRFSAGTLELGLDYRFSVPGW
jgi:hypothetical protein